jgi:hypothetical protein
MFALNPDEAIILLDRQPQRAETALTKSIPRKRDTKYVCSDFISTQD